MGILNVFRASIVFGLLGYPAASGEVLVTKNDLIQTQSGVWAVAELELPKPDVSLPIIGPENSADGIRMFRVIQGQGRVNGFAGIVYDNRDGGHSRLEPGQYPNLTHLKYGPDLIAAGLNFGLGGRVVLPTTVIGNSSTAMTGGPAPRSLPRLAMTSGFWREVTPILYTNNHIYVYPEHRDHDAEDRFPINWPYMLISQGSSGSDRKFLNAIALTLAAFSPDTFSFLREEGLVAPTVQMILRRTLASVSSREEYLSGLAHPAAFDGKLVRPGRMIALAADLRPDTVPPLVRLNVVEEDFSDTAGLAGLSERLLDSPAAIGRLWRSLAWERELVVTAKDTFAPNGRPLTFEWRLLRGDPQRVQIEPQGTDGRTARIRITWHDAWTEQISTGKKAVNRRFSRVDIGVFANNGVHDSAPALISIDFPEHQVREYAIGRDGETRLLSIDYDAQQRSVYFDPVLYWTAPWADEPRYDDGGVLLGWDRRYSKDTSAVFVPYGVDQNGATYQIDRENARVPVLRFITEDSRLENN